MESIVRVRIFSAGLLAIFLGCCPCPLLLAAEGDAAIFLTDMSRCEPAAALASEPEPGKWRLIPYATDERKGIMLGAGSFVEAPEVRLPVDVDGWFDVVLGIWNPQVMYDGQPIIKARLGSRPIFQQIHPGKSPGTQSATFLEEVSLCRADLSDETYIAFAKSNGLQPRSAYFAYVKLVPLSPAQVEAEKSRRQDESRKNLVATFDGSSVFHFSDVSTTDHLLEWVEKLRDSDTKKVLWAVTYGDRTGFPTKNPDLTYLGTDDLFLASPLTFGNGYQRGQRQMQQFFKQCAANGIVPQQLLAEHAHKLGMKFDLMYRIGILGGIGMMEAHKNNFVQQHPEVRQVTRDGRPLQKASLAFPQVQELILDQIDESCRLIDADGINLCFVRGPHFLLWEQPVRAAFEKKYGVSSQDVAEDDPRIDVVRAEIVSNFLKRVRTKLDKVGKTRGKELTLSVWVWPHDQGVWLGGRPLDEGLDVAEWIKLDLLDSVICQEGVDETYIKLGKQHGCEFVLFTGYRGEKAMSPTSLVDAYQKGATTFACWDIDAYQNGPETWQWLQRTGDRAALQKLKDQPELLKRPRFPLIEINGNRVDAGLADAVYSGG